MNTIEKAFKVNYREGWGAIPIFMEAVRGRNFGKIDIGKAFNRLIPKDDYDQEDRDIIVDQCFDITRENK